MGVTVGEQHDWWIVNEAIAEANGDDRGAEYCRNQAALWASLPGMWDASDLVGGETDCADPENAKNPPPADEGRRGILRVQHAQGGSGRDRLPTVGTAGCRTPRTARA